MAESAEELHHRVIAAEIQATIQLVPDVPHLISPHIAVAVQVQAERQAELFDPCAYPDPITLD